MIQVHIFTKLNGSLKVSGGTLIWDFINENHTSQVFWLSCFFTAFTSSMLQPVKILAVWKRTACLLDREPFQMKQEIRPSPVASDHAQMAEPSVVQHGVVEVLTLKNAKNPALEMSSFLFLFFLRRGRISSHFSDKLQRKFFIRYWQNWNVIVQSNNKLYELFLVRYHLCCALKIALLIRDSNSISSKK